MKLSRMAAIPLRQFYLYRGSAARVVPLFAWVTIDMVLWGFMAKFLSGMEHIAVSLCARAAGRGAVLGFHDPRDAGRNHGVL